jgi:hypothetical protein
MPRSVTIQPKESFRKKSEMGASLTSTNDHCFPPSVVRSTVFLERPVFSSITPAAMQRLADGHWKSRISSEAPALS